jgi:deoxyribodipyrimidine photo-lyase
VGADPREDRYFNIIKQANDYDPDCAFIRLWCPELSNLSNDVLKNPMLLTEEMRIRFNVPKTLYPDRVCSLRNNTGSGHGKYQSGSRSDHRMREPKHGSVPGRLQHYNRGDRKPPAK